MTEPDLPLPSLLVRGVGVWIPGRPSSSAFLSGEEDETAQKPAGRILDRMNRRRASALGRALADAAAEAMEEADVDPAVTPAVIGSSLGEATTMVGLLEQMWRRREPASPAAFTMSVHNAAAGLLSISTGNRGFTTSVAADDDTPAGVLFEAIGLIHATGGPIVIAVGDDAVPSGFVAEGERFGLMAVALVLAPDDRSMAAERPALARLVGPHRNGAPDLPPDRPPTLALHPQVGLLDLAEAILRRRASCVALDRGRGQGWRVDVESR